MSTFKQAERKPEDGAVNVSRGSDGFVVLSVTTGGETQSVRMSEFNAARALASLAMMISPLDNVAVLLSKVGRTIKL